MLNYAQIYLAAIMLKSLVCIMPA